MYRKDTNLIILEAANKRIAELEKELSINEGIHAAALAHMSRLEKELANIRLSRAKDDARENPEGYRAFENALNLTNKELKQARLEAKRSVLLGIKKITDKESTYEDCLNEVIEYVNKHLKESD
jgi:hypothetical protein